MRHQLVVLGLALVAPASLAQTVQLGYDVRHSVDPRNNGRNFVTASFEAVKTVDYGSLLMKLDADLSGPHGNLGKVYVQLSHDFRFGRLPLQLHLEYSGGLGVAGDTETAYQIANAYSAGAACAFPLLRSWGSMFLAYRYHHFERPSHDLVYSFWWGGNLPGPLSVTAYVVLWTQNRNRGDAWTRQLDGKKLAALAEPQIWFDVSAALAVGSEVRLYYHVYDYSGRLLVYPIIAAQYRF
jgi:hypothetical protein